MKIPAEMLEILACPQCKGPIEEDSARGGLSCARCRLTYPVRDDIPVMLIDEAEPF